ncbi:MAG: type 4a pilus biogenesis protein PilO [Candidatus Omnitrophica bacterium]|nr:type 4a pilus biogenesis protein PilO [Candidatus Omnitrophota bacterium]
MNILKTMQSLPTIITRLNKKQKRIFYIAVLLVSLLLLERLIIYPIYYKIKTFNKEIQEAESEIKKNLHIISQKDKISQEKDKYYSFLSKSTSEEEEITSILKEIEELANKASIYVEDMKPAGTKVIDSNKKYMITLNCEAQMEQLIDFMYNIENSSKLFSIEKYEINPKARDSSVAKCSMSISKISIP